MESKKKPRTGVSPSSLTPDQKGAQEDDQPSSTDREATSRAPLTGLAQHRTKIMKPSTSASQAAPQELTIPSSKRGAKKSPGPQPAPPSEASGTASLPFSCEQCGKGYRLKSSLARHLKDCGTRDRSKCVHCGMAFPTYAAVRQHEHRAHQTAYRKELEDKLPAPEPILMAQLAKIEAESKIGAPRLKEMEIVTGLSQNMIRYRREKPEYKKFLEAAIKERREKSLKIFKPREKLPAPQPAVPSTSAQATTPGTCTHATSPTLARLHQYRQEPQLPATMPRSQPPSRNPPSIKPMTATAKRKATISPSTAVRTVRQKTGPKPITSKTTPLTIQPVTERTPLTLISPPRTWRVHLQSVKGQGNHPRA